VSRVSDAGPLTEGATRGRPAGRRAKAASERNRVWDPGLSAGAMGICLAASVQRKGGEGGDCADGRRERTREGEMWTRI
jgi:hypothetical protein